jgi:hypothetical protein
MPRWFEEEKMKSPENCTIDRALISLEKAIVNKKAQIQNYRIQPGYSPLISLLYAQVLNRAGGYQAHLTNTLGHGREITRRFLSKAVLYVKEEPWDFIRKVAIYSFAIGLFLGLRHKRSPSPEGGKD